MQLPQSRHPLTDPESLSRPRHGSWAGWGILLMVVYALQWGTNTQRAIRCLQTGHPPHGGWYNRTVTPDWLTIGVIPISLIALHQFDLLPRPRRDRTMIATLTENAAVAMIWTSPIAITRLFLSNLPDIPCHTSAESYTWWDAVVHGWGGPSEEVWFAAMIAVVVAATRNQPRLRLLICLVGGAALRGIFHIYQGWESVGLFIWGAAAAIAVAWTGRWLWIFLLHFLNNWLIVTETLASASAAGAVLTIGIIPFALAKLLTARRTTSTGSVPPPS